MHYRTFVPKSNPKNKNPPNGGFYVLFCPITFGCVCTVASIVWKRRARGYITCGFSAVCISVCGASVGTSRTRTAIFIITRATVCKCWTCARRIYAFAYWVIDNSGIDIICAPIICRRIGCLTVFICPQWFPFVLCIARGFWNRWYALKSNPISIRIWTVIAAIIQIVVATYFDRLAMRHIYEFWLLMIRDIRTTAVSCATIWKIFIIRVRRYFVITAQVIRCGVCHCGRQYCRHT